MQAINTTNNEPKLVKSKARVRDVGEVFTPDFLVKQMLDQYPDSAWDPDKHWLEPTCGNGQFILGIIRRKIEVWNFSIKTALDTTFGCDIMPDNIVECKQRVLNYIARLDNWKNVKLNKRIELYCIIDNNIRHTADALLEDFTSWRCFADQDKETQHKLRTAIEKRIEKTKQKKTKGA